LPGRAYLTLLFAIKKIEGIPENDKAKLYQQLGENLNEVIFW
jgi:hypothetical protein